MHQIENRVMKAESKNSLRRRTIISTENILTGLAGWHGELVNRITGDDKKKETGDDNVTPITETNVIDTSLFQTLTDTEIVDDVKNPRKKNVKKTKGFWS